MRKLNYILLAGLMMVSCAKASQETDDAFKECDAKVVQKIYQTLLDVHDFFTLINVGYWIDSGTLLGAVRHRGLIPWDDDLDLCIFDTDEQVFLKFLPVLKSIGYEIVGMPFGYKIYARDGIEVKGKPWTHPGCDIFIMETNGKKAFYKHRFNKEIESNLEVYLDDILPLRTYTFGPYVVMGPRNPIPYLNNWYGQNCLKLAYRDYDHGNEKAIKKATKIIDENDRKPAKPTLPLERKLAPILIKQWECDFLADYLLAK